MATFLSAYAYALGVVRIVAFWLVVALAIMAVLDWLVRARKLNPFSGPARIIRRTIDPIFVPMERTVVRAGGLPSSAPWWTLVAAVIGGIVLISLLRFIGDQLAHLYFASTLGGMGLVRVAIEWIFSILQLALIVRVVSSMLRVSPWKWYTRWSYVLTEPILAPIRGLIPTVGMFDFSPIVAWIVLSLLESLVLRAL